MKRSHNKTRFTGTWTRTRESILDKYCQTQWSWISTTQLLNNNTYYSPRTSYQRLIVLSREERRARRQSSEARPAPHANGARSLGPRSHSGLLISQLKNYRHCHTCFLEASGQASEELGDEVTAEFCRQAGRGDKDPKKSDQSVIAKSLLILLRRQESTCDQQVFED